MEKTKEFHCPKCGAQLPQEIEQRSGAVDSLEMLATIVNSNMCGDCVKDQGIRIRTAREQRNYEARKKLRAFRHKTR